MRWGGSEKKNIGIPETFFSTLRVSRVKIADSAGKCFNKKAGLFKKNRF
jgi:hypothetical protein